MQPVRATGFKASLLVLIAVLAAIFVPAYVARGTTIDPRDVPEVQIDAPDSTPLGMPLPAVITIRNTDVQARDFTCYVLVRAIAQNGNELGIVTGPRTDPVNIAAGGATVVTSNVSWDQLRRFVGATQFIEFDVVITRTHDQRRWFKERVSVIRGLPVTVALAPAVRVCQPAGVVATVMYSNPLDVPLAPGTLTLSGGSGLPINGVTRSEEIAIPSLSPGASVTLTRTLSAALLGNQMFSAHWFVPGMVPGECMASVTVLPPRAVDFNNSGDVSVQDIFDLLAAHFAASPAADFNNSGDVTVQDIFDFLAAWSDGC